ncbi:hypothetical protein KAFR_0E00650 [Kazachstania africana CBS 2517]|uniref:Protein kinase domain-containing protein n=1 Tax=Kazachstania africana (strain ATCC 22294 / BCRC 22015 / CBS 2517 / CECT 1963 / NBRC 1671 / NRRL Y-8276) TaxID=1071382 RepID=H2AV19_KAZAF|nr:hypothetical protein KAFR_0E00650 [Kazachstania africana CBS 2517]CCF58219.1 hypothetical protein KAFR_0E00650 [Kazachstania africana CBS 2517]
MSPFSRYFFNRRWTLFTGHRFHSYRPLRNRLLLTVPSSSLLLYSKRIILNETLTPDDKGDTYEMGLYFASQQDLARRALQERERQLEGASPLKTILLKIISHLNDNLLEPIRTVLRFVQISLLFIPIILSFPVTLLPVRQSYQIWFKFIRVVLELCGPSFIKLGQWTASRTDIFPVDLCIELSKLHSNVRPHSFTYTESIIKEMFPGELELHDIFEEFNTKSIGCGAIAQVYVAKFNEDFVVQHNLNLQNKWYAIKVIHPHVRNQIKRDLKIMSFFANFIDKIPTMEWLSLPVEVENFEILMNLQLDLRIESSNLKRFNENFKHSNQIKFPEPLLDLCNKDILCEEYLNGIPMGKLLQIKDTLNEMNKAQSNYDDRLLSQRISRPFIDAFLKMLILDDFIHADLHPGNVMVRFIRTNKYGTEITSNEEEIFAIVQSLKDIRDDSTEFNERIVKMMEEYKPQICFIDTGLVTELNFQNRLNFIDLFNSLAMFDGYRAGELMIERSRTPESAINKELFSRKVERLVNRVKEKTFTLGSVSIGDLLNQMLSMVRSHHVRMEGDFVSVVIAILLLEGIGRQLDPDLDLFESSLPLLREFAIKRENAGLLQNANILSMLKLWFTFEIRKLMNLSIRQTYALVKMDQLCPNY